MARGVKSNPEIATENPPIVLVFSNEDDDILKQTVRIWKKQTSLRVLPMVATSLIEALVAHIAEDDQSLIVLVSSGCIPLCLFDISMSMIPKKRNSSYNTKLPLFLSVDKIVSTLEKGNVSDSDFVDIYMNDHCGAIHPLIVDDHCSFAGFVIRENPNIEAVVKAVSERMFLVFDNKGYKAVKPILTKM